MNRPEPIELENNLGPDAVTGEINRVPWKAYDVDEMDQYIAAKDAEIQRLKHAISNGDVHCMGWIDRCQELEEKVETLKNSNAELENLCAYLQKLVDEKDMVISELESENRFVKERLEQQEKTFKWHKVEVLFGKLTGDLPSRDLNRVYGRDFLVHYTVIFGGTISHGIAYSDYDEDEGFFELEDNYTPVHWCEVPLPPLADNFKAAE